MVYFKYNNEKKGASTHQRCIISKIVKPQLFWFLRFLFFIYLFICLYFNDHSLITGSWVVRLERHFEIRAVQNLLNRRDGFWINVPLKTSELSNLGLVVFRFSQIVPFLPRVFDPPLLPSSLLYSPLRAVGQRRDVSSCTQKLSSVWN